MFTRHGGPAFRMAISGVGRRSFRQWLIVHAVNIAALVCTFMRLCALRSQRLFYCVRQLLRQLSITANTPVAARDPARGGGARVGPGRAAAPAAAAVAVAGPARGRPRVSPTSLRSRTPRAIVFLINDVIEIRAIGYFKDARSVSFRIPRGHRQAARATLPSPLGPYHASYLIVPTVEPSY